MENLKLYCLIEDDQQKHIVSSALVRANIWFLLPDYYENENEYPFFISLNKGVAMVTDEAPNGFSTKHFRLPKGFAVALEEARKEQEGVSAGKQGGSKVPEPKDSALDKQVGGNHYKQAAIQPVEYAHANKLGFMEGSVVKYVSRHKRKNGKEDLEKAKHFIELLIDLEYGEERD